MSMFSSHFGKHRKILTMRLGSSGRDRASELYNSYTVRHRGNLITVPSDKIYVLRRVDYYARFDPLDVTA